jgi:hypothetical protein
MGGGGGGGVRGGCAVWSGSVHGGGAWRQAVRDRGLMRIETFDGALKEGARRRLKIALRSYLQLALSDSTEDEAMMVGHVENLVEQSVDAVDAVVLGYPPILSVSRLAPGA